MTMESNIKVKCAENQFYSLQGKLLFHFWPRQSKFSSIIAYGVQITQPSTDNRYGIGVKVQGQIYLESAGVSLRAHKADSSVIFWQRGFIFCTIIDCGV